MPINLNIKSQLCWEQKNSVDAENNELFLHVIWIVCASLIPFA